MAQEFGVAPGDARTAATDALHFWTDTGLFAVDDGALTATLRPLAEVGYAWAASIADRRDQERWIEEAGSTPDLWSSLALAAGLSSELAGSWAQAVALESCADELIAFADAIADGATINTEELAAIVEGSALQHLANPTDAERIAEAILTLPLDAELRERIRPRLTANVPIGRRQLVEALIVARWNEHGIDADQKLRTLLSSPRPEAPHDDSPGPRPANLSFGSAMTPT
jgi:hypothetical protein